MSSWSPRSTAADDEDAGEEPEFGEDRGGGGGGGGVREDLSELTETITRQLWGVASFLAPPPPPPLPRRFSNRLVGGGDTRDQSCSGDEDVDVEVGDEYRRNQHEEEVVGNAVGITEEVLAFAMNIAHHPETWLDFPLDEEEEDQENAGDFDMSDAQRRHVLAVQCLARRLAALRIELCPAHMSEGYFWKVYFVLLHSRLNKQDAELLSTPQTAAARGIWMKELQKRTKRETDWSPRGISDIAESTNNCQESSFDHALLRTSAFGPAAYSATSETETVKHPIVSTETQFVDKAVIEEKPLTTNMSKDIGPGPSFKPSFLNFEEDEDDDWLKEDSELEGYNTTAIVLGNDDDVSFSDLEEDDCDCTKPIKSKIVTIDLGTPRKAFRG